MIRKMLSIAGAVLVAAAACVFAADDGNGPVDKNAVVRTRTMLVSQKTLSKAETQAWLASLDSKTDGGGIRKELDINLVNIDSIINLGTKIITLVTGKAPVISEKMEYANALPQGIKSWTEISGWQPPVAYTFRQVAKTRLLNVLWDVKIMDIQYQVVYMYGGSYNGKGKYLALVTVNPLDVYVRWDHNLDMKCEVLGKSDGKDGGDGMVSNAGTPEDPIASMILKFSWKLQSTYKKQEGASMYNVRGDGQIKPLTVSVMHDAKPMEYAPHYDVTDATPDFMPPHTP